MNKKHKKLVGLFILSGAIAASSLVFAKTREASEPNRDTHYSTPMWSNSKQNNCAIAVEGNEIFIVKDNSILVLDRATLSVIRSSNDVTKSLIQVEPSETKTE